MKAALEIAKVALFAVFTVAVVIGSTALVALFGYAVGMVVDSATSWILGDKLAIANVGVPTIMAWVFVLGAIARTSVSKGGND